MKKANSPTSPARKKRRTTIGAAIFAGILVIGLADACTPNTQPGQQVGTISTTTNTTQPTTIPVPPVTTQSPVVVQSPVATQQPPAQQPTQAAPPPAAAQPDCGANSYVNSDGQCIPDPVSAASAPPGATAKCNDGTYSYSTHHSGTCSGHNGVAEWLN